MLLLQNLSFKRQVNGQKKVSQNVVMRNYVIFIMSLQTNILGQTAVLRCERPATFQGLFLL
jgi:hypothetical protein